MYDAKLNSFILKALAIVPFTLYAPMALWAFSNQAVFRDSVQPITDHSLYNSVDNTWHQFFEQLTPATVWLFIWPFSFAYWLYSRSGLNIGAYCDTKQIKDLNGALDDLPPPPTDYFTYFERLQPCHGQNQGCRGKAVLSIGLPVSIQILIPPVTASR